MSFMLFIIPFIYIRITCTATRWYMHIVVRKPESSLVNLVCHCLACSNKHCLNLLIFKQIEERKTKCPGTPWKAGKVGGAGLDVMQGEDGYFHSDWSSKVATWYNDSRCPPCPSYPSYPSWNGQPKIEVDNDDLSVLTCFNNVIVTYHQAPDKKCQLWTALRASTVFNISEKIHFQQLLCQAQAKGCFKMVWKFDV